MSRRIVMPPLVIDSREQCPLQFPSMVEVKRGALKTGDYSISGYEDRFTVERKSLSDLVGTVIHDRERFERELTRMMEYQFRRIIVTVPYATVAKGGYSFSRANPRSVVASLNAFEVRYQTPVIFAANPAEAALRVLNWAYYFTRQDILSREEREAAGGSGGVCGEC